MIVLNEAIASNTEFPKVHFLIGRDGNTAAGADG